MDSVEYRGKRIKMNGKAVYSAHFCESALGAVEHNDFEFLPVAIA